MSSREEPPYDPYIPSGGAGGQQGAGQGQNGNHRTAALQAVRRFHLFPPSQSAAAVVACLQRSCGRAVVPEAGFRGKLALST
ncbi:Synaptobrevin [Pyrenophora seminiperda CCB06]|uniref:Synaptobrevin n=1 Tax=Pyrenophora seminiperda CCB06 TaxID=1302712 RepID=A0A3M7M9G3_9PLEO|nr:Synaptobrevin [Pyrenophora seminiperda CCB06]